MSTTVITGERECEIVREYLEVYDRSTSSKQQETERVFCHLTKEKRVIGPIGHNPLSNAGKILAEAAGLENPSQYTGHSWRRTAITDMAEEGLDLAHIKQVSGHKSDSVVQGYVHNTVALQLKAADCLAVGKTLGANKRSADPLTELDFERYSGFPARRNGVLSGEFRAQLARSDPLSMHGDLVDVTPTSSSSGGYHTGHCWRRQSTTVADGPVYNNCTFITKATAAEEGAAMKPAAQ